MATVRRRSSSRRSSSRIHRPLQHALSRLPLPAANGRAGRGAHDGRRLRAGVRPHGAGAAPAGPLGADEAAADADDPDGLGPRRRERRAFARARARAGAGRDGGRSGAAVPAGRARVQARRAGPRRAVGVAGRHRPVHGAAAHAPTHAHVRGARHTLDRTRGPHQDGLSRCGCCDCCCCRRRGGQRGVGLRGAVATATRSARRPFDIDPRDPHRAPAAAAPIPMSVPPGRQSAAQRARARRHVSVSGASVRRLGAASRAQPHRQRQRRSLD